jgi:hypothetical protein
MNKITLVEEVRKKGRDGQFNSLLGNEWEIATLSDHCDLFCVLTRSSLMIRLYDENLGSVYYEHVDELFDTSRICEQIEHDTGLCLEPFQWCDLLESIVIHNPPDVTHVRSVF